MKVTVTHPAPEGSRFADGAFDEALGQTFPFRQLDGEVDAAPAVLLAASVVDEGRAVELTLSIPDPTPARPR